MLSILDIFKIGIGPSSSHTMGPMRIAARFLADLEAAGCIRNAARIVVELQGSLALTGAGHATDHAVMLGLQGFVPETTDPDLAAEAVRRTRETRRLQLPHGPEIAFDPRSDIDFRGDIIPDLHPNGMKLLALDGEGGPLLESQFFSVGGGFIARPEQLAGAARDDIVATARSAPYPFRSGAELLQFCERDELAISDIVLTNEDTWRPREETLQGLDGIWSTMAACMERGLMTTGVLPGTLKVARRAPHLYRKLTGPGVPNEAEAVFDRLNAYAMAVNEENAAGGRVVTAPTNGAAGIIPAVIRLYCADRTLGDAEGETVTRAHIRTFLLTAGAIGLLYKQRASISGAEMGCQGEVGVACSMAAAGLAAVWGGDPRQIEHAAEIGMEHNLGLTCDPVGGLVQIPCIERNAIGAVKAVNAARLAIGSTGDHKVTLDQVIESMRQTGLDMSNKYKETSTGGLAVNVVAC